MNVLLLYTPNTPDDRAIAELQRRTEELRVPMRLVSADSREGAALSELYGVYQRPTVIVTDANGSEIQKWQGMLPSAEDVRFFAAANT